MNETKDYTDSIFTQHAVVSDRPGWSNPRNGMDYSGATYPTNPLRGNDGPACFLGNKEGQGREGAGRRRFTTLGKGADGTRPSTRDRIERGWNKLMEFRRNRLKQLVIPYIAVMVTAAVAVQIFNIHVPW